MLCVILFSRFRPNTSQDLADYRQDYLKAPQLEPLTWESDESGRKCLIGILSEKAPDKPGVGWPVKRATKTGNWEALLVEIVRVSQWI